MWNVGALGNMPAKYQLPALVCGLLVVLSLALWCLASMFGLQTKPRKVKKEAPLARGGSIYLHQEGKTVRRSARIAGGTSPLPKGKVY
ncbi:hypothetical protein BSKO_11972 [Bryopsis sp. KO-2023]|nr:hypothetical protein BSKO_11972 [Bryopsis sp. KO-2023]